MPADKRAADRVTFGRATLIHASTTAVDSGGVTLTIDVAPTADVVVLPTPDGLRVAARPR